MAYRCIHPPSIRGAAGLLRSPSPRTEARNQGDYLPNGVFCHTLTISTTGNDHKGSGLSTGTCKLRHGHVGYHLGTSILIFGTFWLMPSSSRFLNGSLLPLFFLASSSCYSYIRTWQSSSPIHPSSESDPSTLLSSMPPSASFWSFH